MGFANIAGLSALIFVPLIIVLYMLRPKHKPKKIPSLYLWQSVMDEIESASRLRRLRNSLLMILQILAVLLLAFILAGLFIKDDQIYKEVIVVVDSGLSMQSTDISPSRHVYAKELAADYVKKLEAGSYVTVVALGEVPNIVVNKTNDMALAIRGIEGLTVSNSYWDPEVVAETLGGLRDDIETGVIYFGDHQIENATTYLTIKDRNNAAVYEVISKTYAGQGTMSILTEVYNDSEEPMIIPLSVYVDDLFFGAKEVTVEAGESAKVFFDGLPIQTDIIKVAIDRPDILEADNVAYGVVKQDEVKKVLLVSSGNIFLEKVLKLSQNIELYQVTPDTAMVYEGYALYIFDGYYPESAPTDGNIITFDPSEHVDINALGHVENPDITSSGSVMTSTIEKTEFRAGVTQVFELPEDAVDIYTTSYGSCGYVWQNGLQKVVIYGFDIHHTDLPLSIEFPILMANTLKHTLDTSMAQASSIGSGDSIEIKINPSTTKAYISDPNQIDTALDLSRASGLYTNTSDLGLYTINYENHEGSHTEIFAVNTKKPSSDLIRPDYKDGQIKDVRSTRSLKLTLGLVLLVILLLEWLIYNNFSKLGIEK